MKIIPISVLEDNYSYILIDDKSKEAAVIDPVEPIKILNVISQTGSKLSRYSQKSKREKQH
jgi:hydroxyacylglutathione hydrolase